jgi:hypothetical protein
MTKPVPSKTMTALLAGITSLWGPESRLACRVLAYRESIPSGLAGGYVALTSAERSLQIGLLSDMLGWQSLRGVVETDEVRARYEVVEGGCELVTEVARGLVSRLAGDFSIGLPLFVDGSVLTCPDTEVQAADIVLGATRALLVLLTPRSLVSDVAAAPEPSTPRAASVAPRMETSR